MVILRQPPHKKKITYFEVKSVIFVVVCGVCCGLSWCQVSGKQKQQNSTHKKLWKL